MEVRAGQVSRAEMESLAELLGHDLYEGRAPGTRGGDLAQVTMQGLFKFMDLEPGAAGSYFQPFVMKGFSTYEMDLTVNGTSLNYPEEIVGNFTLEKEEAKLLGEAVFVGFGITTELWDWDDYKDSDVRDRIIITRVNDPGMVNPEIFEGNTLTFFGRWTYHIEEAARRSAAGILLIHTDESVGYDWNVVQNNDRSTIVANINFESTPVWGKSVIVMGIGARFSGFEPHIRKLAQRDGLEYSTFSLGNQGLFYRSDQFSFARYGIPSVWISAGEDEVSGTASYTGFWGGDYHTVDDEFSPDWSLEQMHLTIRYALLLVDHINRTRTPPQLNQELPFPVEMESTDP